MRVAAAPKALRHRRIRLGTCVPRRRVIRREPVSGGTTWAAQSPRRRRCPSRSVDPCTQHVARPRCPPPTPTELRRRTGPRGPEPAGCGGGQQRSRPWWWPTAATTAAAPDPRRPRPRRGPARPRPQRHVFDPSMPVGRSRPGRRDHRAAGRQRVRHPAVRPAVQAGHLRHRGAAAEHPGRLLHRGGRARASARPTSTINGQRRRLQPLLRDHGSCIALNNFWRSMSNLTINVAGGDGLPRSGQLLGGVAGRADAPGEHQRRQPDADGLLHAARSSPAAASWPTRRPGRSSTDPSSSSTSATRASAAGRTACGTRCSPACRARRPQSASRGDAAGPYTTLPTTPAQPGEALPVRRRRRRLAACSCPAAQTDSAGTTWAERPTPRAARSRSRDFFVAKPGDSVSDHQRGAGAGQEPAAHARRLRRRPEHRGQPAPTRSCSGLGMATLTAVNGAVPITVGDVPGVDVAGLMIDAGTGQLAGAACRSARPATAADAAARRRPDRAARRLLPGRRAARRQGHHSAW